ncbi:MAG: C45 family autoproteolytic acyltransferase/hydrolase [Candidatus Acidiferrales bacterium]
MQLHRSRLPFVFLIILGFALVATQLHVVASRQVAHASGSAASPQRSSDDSRLAKAYRFERGGWIYVHLEGVPHDIGYQHGYLLAPEIADAFASVSLNMTHSTQRDWEFFRRTAREMLWPKIDPEYQAELDGIAEGIQAQKVKLDRDDIVAMNAFEELPGYYVPWLNDQTKAAGAPKIKSPEHCSAFVATGSWTKDHQIVMAHNNWTNYANGERWRIIFDIVPEQGYHILMDGFPGVIASDDDFGVNSNGLMITETTISSFHGWDPNGKAEFVRARKAMQYAGSIDQYVKIMLDGNNGGYANDWLLGDRKTGEIAQFELGLRKTKLYRTKDGYFVGSNFVSDPEVLKEDTTFDPTDPASSPNARHIRWEQLIKPNMGKIDTTLAEAFISDHYDSYTKKTEASRRTLCGHGDASSEDDPNFGLKPYEPVGAVQGKVTDSSMTKDMSFIARMGHPCGTDFKASKFIGEHSEYRWMSPILRDMNAGPWTPFKSAEPDPSSPSAPAGLTVTPN